MKQIERINYYENILNEGEKTLLNLTKAIEDFYSLEAKIKKLDTYYQSKERSMDVAADEAGLLPRDLKRGVLAEDYAWDLLVSYYEYYDALKKLK